MDRILNEIINNEQIKEFSPEIYKKINKAGENYFIGEFENVIYECVPLCESILREVCKEYDVRCGLYNMCDMIDKIDSSDIQHSDIQMSYLHVMRVMMNKKRHGADDGYKITICDAYMAIYSTYLTVVWYMKIKKVGRIKDILSIDNNRELKWEDRYSELKNVVDNVEFEMSIQILRKLLNGKISVDRLIYELNASRVVILKAITILMEKNFIIWDENNEDIIMINDSIYNNRHLIERIVSEKE